MKKNSMSIIGHSNFIEEELKNLNTINIALMNQVKEMPSFQKPIGHTKLQKQQITSFNKYVKVVKTKDQMDNSFLNTTTGSAHKEKRSQMIDAYSTSPNLKLIQKDDSPIKIAQENLNISQLPKGPSKKSHEIKKASSMPVSNNIEQSISRINAPKVLNPADLKKLEVFEKRQRATPIRHHSSSTVRTIINRRVSTQHTNYDSENSNSPSKLAKSFRKSQSQYQNPMYATPQPEQKRRFEISGYGSPRKDSKGMKLSESIKQQILQRMGI